MKINAIDLKPGNVLEHQNKLWLVLKREIVQPGKGGAFTVIEIRDLRSGNKATERFRTQETVERVRLDEKEMQFLYMEDNQATFMDNDSFEQVTVPRELIGDPAALADAMAGLYQDQEEWSRARGAALARVERYYTERHMLDRYADVYRGALG